MHEHFGAGAIRAAVHVVAAGKRCVHEDTHLRNLTFGGLAVAVKEVEVGLGSVNGVDVGSHIQIKVNGRQHGAARGELRRVTHERTQRDGLLWVNPVRSLIGALHGFVFEVANAVVVTDHLRTGSEHLGGYDKILIVTAADEEHLFVLSARNVAKLNAGTFKSGQFREKCRLAVVGGKDDEMALGRNFTEVDGEFCFTTLR